MSPYSSLGDALSGLAGPKSSAAIKRATHQLLTVGLVDGWLGPFAIVKVFNHAAIRREAFTALPTFNCFTSRH
jgi:hypothetical protein